MKQLVLMMLLAAAAAGCSHFPELDQNTGADGSLSLQVFPGTQFDPRELGDLCITGYGPRGAVFTRYMELSGAPLHIESLPAGTWNITAESRNLHGAVIAAAGRKVTVHQNRTAEAALLLMPDTAPGELMLTVRGQVRPGLQTAAAVQHVPRQRVTQLVPAEFGNLRTRLFAGHYLLTASLLNEEDTVLWSGITPVRVLGGEQSTVTLAFDEQGVGRFSSEASHQPLSVKITGIIPELPAGEIMRLALQVSPGLYDAAEYLFLWCFSGREALTTVEPVFTYRAPSRTGLRHLTVLVLMVGPRGRILQAGSTAETFAVTQ